MSTAMTPNQREIIAAQSTVDGQAEYLTSTGGKLNVIPDGLIPNTNFDYLSVVNTNTAEDTLTYKTGGAGGTAVLTLVITYTDDTVDKISDTLSTLAWS